MAQVAFQHQRHLRLHLGLQGARESDLLAVANRHVVEQHAEVGRIDAELLLHR